MEDSSLRQKWFTTWISFWDILFIDWHIFFCVVITQYSISINWTMLLLLKEKRKSIIKVKINHPTRRLWKKFSETVSECKEMQYNGNTNRIHKILLLFRVSCFNLFIHCFLSFVFGCWRTFIESMVGMALNMLRWFGVTHTHRHEAKHTVVDCSAFLLFHVINKCIMKKFDSRFSCEL